MQTFTISDTSPATASTAAGSYVSGLSKYRGFVIVADLVGATGGALDVYLQRKLAPNMWQDWCHFAQLASGASAVRYVMNCDHVNATTIATATVGTDAAPGVALGAATFVGGHPGDMVRAVYVAGASTSAGAAVKIYLIGIQETR